jgi:hypothetical protein
VVVEAREEVMGGGEVQEARGKGGVRERVRGGDAHGRRKRICDRR